MDIRASSWWQLSKNEVAKKLDADLIAGLSSPTAAQRLLQYGPHELPQQGRSTVLVLFLRQWQNVAVLFLLIAIGMSLLLQQWVDAASIGAILLLNILIGFFQEYAAEKSLAALRRLTKPSARIIRDGRVMIVPSHDLVLGDLILLEAGSLVPADARVIESHDLTIDEALLTGESEPVIKLTEPLAGQHRVMGDQLNMVFMGTTVVAGRGNALITGTGRATELGRIASFVQAVPEETSLHRQLAHVQYVLIVASLLIAAIIFGLGLMRGMSLIPMILTIISLIVAAIPEGLPTVITVALASAVKRMARKHALIRRLASVETLGVVSIICTDKTGTLTQNRMQVRHLWLPDCAYDVTGIGWSPVGLIERHGNRIKPEQLPALMNLLKIGALCNGAVLQEKEPGEWSVIGDPTEGALLAVAAKGGLSKQNLEKELPLVREYSFDSVRKRMSMLRRTSDTGFILFVKGAADSILSACTHILLHDKVMPLTLDMKYRISQQNDYYSEQALRVLAAAYREGDETMQEENLIFVGLFAMSDPPRPEAKAALQQAQAAGIRTIMLTGDHAHTARAIALETGLMQEYDQLFTGAELDELADNGLDDVIQRCSVFARVSVEHKIRIVQALKRRGETVAMTGDGVNDAPALKVADVGIAMGITGAEVTKEASDLVLTDDNFASIIPAIEEGRAACVAIAQCATYLLTSNIAELMVVLWGAIIWSAAAGFEQGALLLPVHLLWVNLMSDGLPALALAFEPSQKRFMRMGPDYFRAPLFSGRSLIRLGLDSFLLSLAVLGVGLYGLRTSIELGQTMAFTGLVFLEFVRLSTVRADFQASFFSNFWILIATALSLFLQCMIVYVPALQKFFHTVSLGAHDWLVIAVACCVLWLINSLLRFFRKAI